jgi:hypothetical protein
LKDFTSEVSQMNTMRLSMVILHMQSLNKNIFEKSIIGC